MTCVCGHQHDAHALHVSGAIGMCWVVDCDCKHFQLPPLGGSGPESPDRVAPSARSTPAETTVAKPLDEPVATDEPGSSLTHRNIIEAVAREIDSLRLARYPEFEDSARLGWLAAAAARFLNNHPEHRAELLPELDPETTETTW